MNDPFFNECLRHWQHVLIAAADRDRKSIIYIKLLVSKSFTRLYCTCSMPILISRL